MPSVLGNTPLGTSIALESDLQQSLTAVTGKPFDAEVEYVTVPAGTFILPEIDNVGPDIVLSMNVRIDPDGISSSSKFLIGNWRGAATKSIQLYAWGQNEHGGGFNSSADTSVNPSDAVGQFATVGIFGNTLRFGSRTATISPNQATLSACEIAIGGGYVEADGAVYPGNHAFDLASFFYAANGAVTRDLVPVRVGQVGYLYDKVSGRLFGSASSVALVPGPDASTPTFTPKTEIDLLAPLASPALTGTPTAPTAASGTNTTQLATTAFVQTAIANAVQDLDLSIVSGKLCVTFEE